jgi:hypothetical protein
MCGRIPVPIDGSDHAWEAFEYAVDEHPDDAGFDSSRVDIVTREGRPADESIALADTDEIDQVVMGTGAVGREMTPAGECRGDCCPAGHCPGQHRPVDGRQSSGVGVSAGRAVTP